MSLVHVRYAENKATGNDAIVFQVGRRSSERLNNISYKGRTDWTPAETAFPDTVSSGVADPVTVELTIFGQTQSVTIANPDNDASRNLRSLELPQQLTEGVIYPFTLRETGAAAGVDDLVEGVIMIASATQKRYGVTACFGNAIPASALLGNDVTDDFNFGDSDFNYVVNGDAPIAGVGAFITRRMQGQKLSQWWNVDDGLYLALTTINGSDEAPPLTLTDTLDDSPVALVSMRVAPNAYNDYVLAASPDFNGAVEAQMLYCWHDWSLRREDIAGLSRDGGQKTFRIWGDNEVWNNWDGSWWQLAIASGGLDGMTTPAGDPYADASFNPADFSNVTNATLQIEANTYFRVLRSLFENYWGQFMPAPTELSQAPWVVRELQASANPDPNFDPSDYVPYTTIFNDGLGDVVVLDTLTCTDLTPINSSISSGFVEQEWINHNTAKTHWLDGSGGDLRLIESPLGDANDANIKAAISGSSAPPIVMSAKQFGSLGDGNTDDLFNKNPNWVRSWYNTVVQGAARAVLIMAGDHHLPSAIGNGKASQIGVAPASWAGLADYPAAGGQFSDLVVDVDGLTSPLANQTINASWSIDIDTPSNSIDRYRTAYGIAVRSASVLYATAIDHRGGSVAPVYQLTTSIQQGGTLPSPEVSNMARSTITAAIGANGQIEGCGVFSLVGSSTLARAGGSVYEVLRRSNGTVAATILGAANRTGSPARGPMVTVLCDSGDINSATTVLADQINELPETFTVAFGGYTFSREDITASSDITVDGVTYRTFSIGWGGDITVGFGGDLQDGLNATVPRWSASEAVSSGDRRLSIDGDIELVAQATGTAGTTEPPVDGNYDTTVSDGSISWNQVPPTGVASFDVEWTDPTASSGGSTSAKKLIPRRYA